MRLSLLLSASLAGHGMAVKMSDRFTVSSSCSETSADAVMTETIDMVNTAINAIDTLLAAKMSLSSRSGNAQVASLMRAAKNAFGVAEPGTFTFSLSSQDSAQLTTAQCTVPTDIDIKLWEVADWHEANYKTLLAALQDGTDMSPEQNYLYCDSTILKWATVSDPKLIHRLWSGRPQPYTQRLQIASDLNDPSLEHSFLS